MRQALATASDEPTLTTSCPSRQAWAAITAQALAAIGAFYRPDWVVFSISGNMGNGENMVNAGVSALDRPSKTPTTVRW